MNQQWELFRRLAKRHLEDGVSDDEAIEGACKHMGRYAPTDRAEARRHVEDLRSALLPEQTEGEAWAMLDDAVARAFRTRPAEPVRQAPDRDPRRHPSARTRAINDGGTASDGREPMPPPPVELVATIQAYRRWKAKPGNGKERPTQEAIAEERGISEKTLAKRLRDCGVEDFRGFHTIAETWPD
jgi:hypothetical protein